MAEEEKAGEAQDPAAPPAPQGPELDIPDLKKKKEEEKKKAGAAWGAGKAPGSPFSGATGGTIARTAASAARVGIGTAAGAGAGAGGGVFAGFAAQISALWATLAGKLILGAIAAVMALGAVAALQMLAGGGAGDKRSSKGLDLGGIASSIKVDKGGSSKALQFASQSAGGQLQFGKAPGAKKAETAKADESAKAEETAKAGEDFVPEGGVQAGDTGEAGPTGRSAFGSGIGKLSSGLGGDFGNKNVFQAGPKFGSSVGVAKEFSKGSLGGGGRGRLARTGARAGRRLNVGKHGMRSSRALGQLRGMQTRHGAMTTMAPTSEKASSEATGQFEGARPTEAPPSDADGGGSTGNPSGGGGGPSGGPSGGTGPFPPGYNPEAPQAPIQHCSPAQLESEENCYSTAETCVCTHEVQPPSDETPWKEELEACEGMLWAMMAILLTIGTLRLIANALLGSVCTAAIAAVLTGIAIALTVINCILAVIVGIIGGIIAADGGGLQGGLLIGVAAINAICTITAMVANPGAGMVLGALIGAATTAAGAAMAGSMAEPPDLPPMQETYDAGSSAEWGEEGGSPGSSGPQ